MSNVHNPLCRSWDPRTLNTPSIPILALLLFNPSQATILATRSGFFVEPRNANSIWYIEDKAIHNSRFIYTEAWQGIDLKYGLLHNGEKRTRATTGDIQLSE